ncbi:MAG: pilin [Candidatus Thiodiazotropha sp.]
MNHQRTQGFVFIELLLVLAIVSILAVVALPAYKDYKLRAVISEGLKIILPIRERIEEFHAYHGHFPKDNSVLDMLPADQLFTKHLESIEVKQGAITIRYRRISLQLDSTGLLTLRPALNNTLPTAPIIWACGNAKPENRKLIGDNLTNLDNKLIPAACRE